MKRICLIVIPFLLFCSCKEPAPSPGVSNSTDSETPQIQKFKHFSLAIPSGWQVVEPDRGKSEAIVMKYGRDNQDARAMLKVDVGKPVTPDARVMAEKVAKMHSGNIEEDPVLIDGENAYWVRTNSTSFQNPREILVAYRKDQVFLLMLATVDDTDLATVLDQIKRTWKWLD